MLKIHRTTDPILRAECEPVKEFDFELQKLIDEMVETMRQKKGVGLAAPQVGVSKKIFICEFEGDKESKLKGFPLTVICNPEIVKKSKQEKIMVEGCLSFPGLEVLIKRPKNIVIKGQDRFGHPIEINADGFFSRVIQHENDHLNSTLLIDKIHRIKIVFIGTGTLGLRTLELLAKYPQYEILAVVTGERKTVISRQEKETNHVLAMAEKLKLPVIQTVNLNRDKRVIEKIKKLKPDLGVMADFGQIISKEVLDIPKKGIINIHPSLLPSYRGPSPIQQTILNGDEETGVSLIMTSDKMDAGDIVSQVRVKLNGNETSTILKDYLSELAANLFINTIPYYFAGDLAPIIQEEDKATYTEMVQKGNGVVTFDTPAIEVERKIRAFDEWPKVSIEIKGKKVQLLSSHFSPDNELVIDLVKPEGKKTMNYTDFVNGYRTELTFK